MKIVIDEKKLLTISVIISLIGTASLYMYSANQEAEMVGISEIDEQMVGAHVETSGVISDLINLGGRYLIDMKEESSEHSITVFVDERVLSHVDKMEEIRAGAEANVRGEIDMYEDDLNLIVSRAGDFMIEKTAYSSFTRPGELLDNPEWHEGMDHKIRGEIVSIRNVGEDSILEIEPLEGRNCRIMSRIDGWDFTEDYSISKGSIVVVMGTFEYDGYRGRWCIYSEKKPEVHG